MKNQNFYSEKNTISDLEQLLKESHRLKEELKTSDYKSLSASLQDLEKYYLRWVIQASEVVRKSYKPLISSRIGMILPDLDKHDGESVRITKRKSILLGDVVCIEDDIRKKLIELKKLTSEKSHLIREMILKEIAENEDTSRMHNILQANLFGAMARYIKDNHVYDDEIYPDEKKFFPRSVEHIKHYYEMHFKDRLKRELERQLQEKISLLDFDIAYLEMRDELGEKKEEKAGYKSGRRQVASKDEDESYVVFLPRLKGMKTFIDSKAKTENQVHKKYVLNKEKFDIFIYEQNVYKKVFDEGKAKMISLNPSISFRGLLTLFLKYKDVSLPYVELYHKSFCETKGYNSRATDPKDVMNNLKNSVNELKKEFNYIKEFNIPHAKNFQYICEGDINFCLILKKETSRRYTMLFDKFKVPVSIPEEA